jgi:GT2 family glycosyltransferase
MYNIAVLLTCFNRKTKTLTALEHLYAAYGQVRDELTLTIYLTDDGSTDGTGAAVKAAYPEAKVLQGTGSLYWAGGMRHSWTAALKGHYDAFLLLNDDTNVVPHLFTELLETHAYCLGTYGMGGVYMGSTQDGPTGAHSYGGHVFTNKFMAQYVRVLPNGQTPQPAELGNANIMWVSKDVVEQIGILSDSYIHGLADYDYTLMAVKHKLPVMITRNYLGTCINDHTNPYLKFPKMSFKERMKLLYNPVGLDFRSNLQYNWRNFPYRLPIVYVMGWVKVLFPSLYLKRYNNL